MTTSVSAAEDLAAAGHHDLKVRPQVCPMCKARFPAVDVTQGLRSPNEGIKQRNLKFLANMADKNMLRPYLKIWDWDLIFGRAVKAISSPGVRSP